MNFTVDDTANRVFRAGDLAWKGSMSFDATTREVKYDSLWPGPWPTLYDDGPWTAGGHEPAGNSAGDHRWGVTVFVRPPATGTQSIEYGVVDTSESDTWLWRGSNGVFRVDAGATGTITAPGQAFPAFGARDVRVVLDATAADLSPSVVRLKGSCLGWTSAQLSDDGTHGDDVARDGRFTFQLRVWVGPGTAHPHLGLLSSGDRCEFLFELDGTDYREDGLGGRTGVTAFVTGTSGTFVSAPVQVEAANFNTYVTVP